MQRSVQLVYILFFSVMYGAAIRSSQTWHAFPTHYFRLPNRDLRAQEGRRFWVAVLLLNVLPFLYFAVTVYLFGTIHQDAGWLMVADYFSAPVVAMAVPGFSRIYQGAIVWGRERRWPAAWERIEREHAPFADARAYVIPGLIYLAVSATALAIVLAI
jgi:hypothetical protein